MRAQGRLGLLAGVALCLGTTVLAQGPRRNFLNPVMLLNNTSVRKELKVTPQQEPKVKEALARVLEQYKGGGEKLRGKTPQEIQEYFKKRNEDALKTMAGILDARQMKRLEEIHLQMIGLDVFREPQVAKALQLSEEQNRKIEDIEKDLQKQQLEIIQNTQEPLERIEKIRRSRKEAQQKAAAVLTEKQKKSWKTLVGEPFEIKPDNPS